MKEQVMTYSTAGQVNTAFWIMLVLNGLVFLLANMLFPMQIVLGTSAFSLWWALFHSSLIITLVGTLHIAQFEWAQKNLLKRTMSNMEWMLGYFVINFIGLWLITRVPEQFGLGVAHWWILLLLAIALDFVQGMGMMLVYKKK